MAAGGGHHEAAVQALRGGDWVRAAVHLLALVFDEQVQSARGVLITLERAQPAAYWRAAFIFALSHGGWNHAAAALVKLAALTPPPDDLPDLHEQLRAARDAPRLEAFPGGEAQIVPKSLAELLHMPAPHSIDDRPHDLPLPEEVAPPDFADAPTVPGHMPQSLPEVNLIPMAASPEARLALKAVAFGEEPDHTLGVSGGAVYNALDDRLALKSPDFAAAELLPPGIEDTPSMPGRPPAEPPRQPEDTPEWPAPPILPVSALDTAPRQIGEAPHAAAMRQRKDVLGRLFIALSGLLIILVLGSSLLYQSNARTPTPQATQSAGAETPTVTNPPPQENRPGDLSAFIADVDRQIQQAGGSDAPAYLRDTGRTVLALVPEKTPLQTALLDWIEVGAVSLESELARATACDPAPRSDECTAARQLSRVSAAAAESARERVCALTDCPPHS